MKETFSQAGQRIAGRYDLLFLTDEQLPYATAEVWEARDIVLSRRVRAIVVDGKSPAHGLVADAARRAALVEDARTVSILSVVPTPETAVITEIPPGTPLSLRLGGDPIDPAQIRAIVGEVASAINTARHRGVRHLQLRAQNIWISDSGQVVLDGLGVQAALEGIETSERSGADLDRSEARGLTVLLASLLLGREYPEPALHDAYVREASELENLPGALSELLSREIGGAGANSPNDFMSRLVPWGDVDPVRLPALLDGEATRQFQAIRAEFAEGSKTPKGSGAAKAAVGAVGAAGVAGAAGLAGDTAGTVDAGKSTAAGAATAAGAPEASLQVDHSNDPDYDPLVAVVGIEEAPKLQGSLHWKPVSAQSLDDDGLRAITPVAEPEGDVAVADSVDGEAADIDDAGVAGDADAISDGTPSEPVVDGEAEMPAEDAEVPAEPEVDTDAEADAGDSSVTDDFDDPDATAERAAITAAIVPAEDASSTDASATQATEALPKLEPDADPAPAAPAPTAVIAPAAAATAAVAAGAAAPVRKTVFPPIDPEASQPRGAAAPVRPDGSPARSAAATQAARPSSEASNTWSDKPEFPEFDQDGRKSSEPVAAASTSRVNPTKWVIGFFALLVLVAGGWGISKAFSGFDPVTLQNQTPEASATNSDGATATTQAPTLDPPVVKSIKLLNPDAALLTSAAVEDQDFPENVGRIIDRNPATVWKSYTYTNVKLRPKSGLGLYVELEKEAKISEVNLIMNGAGGNMQLRDTVESAAASGKLIVEGPMSANTVLKAPEPFTGTGFVIWVNELPQIGGENRLEIAELTVK